MMLRSNGWLIAFFGALVAFLAFLGTAFEAVEELFSLHPTLLLIICLLLFILGILLGIGMSPVFYKGQSKKKIKKVVHDELSPMAFNDPLSDEKFLEMVFSDENKDK